MILSVNAAYKQRSPSKVLGAQRAPIKNIPTREKDNMKMGLFRCCKKQCISTGWAKESLAHALTERQKRQEDGFVLVISRTFNMNEKIIFLTKTSQPDPL